MSKVIISKTIDSFRLGQKVISNHYEIKGNSPIVESIQEICMRKP